MTRRQIRRLQMSAVLVLVGFATGVLYRYVQWRFDASALDSSLPGAGATGALIAGLVVSVELVYLPSRYGAWMRRQSFLALLLMRAVIAAVPAR